MAVLSSTKVLPGPMLGLSSGLDDLLVVEVGGRRVIYALNRAEGVLLELSFAPEGDLSVDGSLALSGTISVGADPQLALGNDWSGASFLTLAGVPQISGQIVSLSSSGGLGAQQSLTGVGALEQVHGFTIGNVPVLISAATEGGLAHFAYSGAGFTSGVGLLDTSERNLADVSAVIGFSQAGVAYVATASASESGINIARVTEVGLTQTGAIGAADSLPIGTPSGLAEVTRLGETLLLVTSEGTSSLSVLAITDGAPNLMDHIYDGEDTHFQGARDVAAVALGDFAYAVVGGNEGGVSIFTILPGGRLLHLDSVAEDENVPLATVAAVDVLVNSGALSVLASSETEAGLTHLSYDLSSNGSVAIADPDGLGVTGTALNDQIIGSVVGEALSGSAGDDILLDGRGNDVLTGGAGADIFVLTADGQSDQITDFEPGVDRLDLSAFDFLYDAAQLTVAPTAIGATVSFGGETIFIASAEASPLTLDDLPTSAVLNVDRPPFLLVGREIVGTGADETLNGGAGNDTIAGAGGNDGLFGSAGLDVLSGSLGEDTLSGGNDRDTLVGGLGDDLLFGGDGSDVIYGDDWA